jgi:hypothetical protein
VVDAASHVVDAASHSIECVHLHSYKLLRNDCTPTATPGFSHVPSNTSA